MVFLPALSSIVSLEQWALVGDGHQVVSMLQSLLGPPTRTHESETTRTCARTRLMTFDIENKQRASTQ